MTLGTGCAEAQVLFVRKLRDVVAEEQGDACLEVEVSHEAAEVQWLKQGILLQPGSKYQLQESGRRRTLTIRCLGPADRGTYRCESLHDRTQARLCVEREYRTGDGARARDGDGESTSLLQGCCRLEEGAWAELVLCLVKGLDLGDQSSKHRLGIRGLWGGAGTHSWTRIPCSPEGVDPNATGRRGDLREGDGHLPPGAVSPRRARGLDAGRHPGEAQQHVPDQRHGLRAQPDTGGAGAGGLGHRHLHR